MIQVRVGVVLLALSIASSASADATEKYMLKIRKESLETLARGKKPEERAEAAERLGGYADPETLAALTRALEDPDALVRENAARALWRLHKTAGPAQAALRARLDDVPDVVVAAAGALEAQGVDAKELVPARMRALERGTPWARFVAARSLVGYAPAAKLLPALLDQFFQDASSPLTDTDGRKRRDAALESIKELTKTQDRTVLPPLVESLRRATPGRDHLLRALAHYEPPPDGWLELLVSLLSTSDPDLQDEAVSQLGKLRTEPEVAVWAPAVARLLRSAKLRQSAIRALGGAGSLAHASAVPIAAALQDPDARVRESAAEALGTIGDRAQPGPQAMKQEIARVARGPLEGALASDPVRDVRGAAARALNRLQLDPAEVTAVLARAAARPQEESLVRQSILIALRNRGGEAKAALPVLEAYLPQSGDMRDLVEAALESIRSGKVHEPTLAPAAAGRDPEAEKRAHSYLRARGVDFEQSQFAKALNEADLQVVAAFLDAGMAANRPFGQYQEWPLNNVLRWGPCDPKTRPTPDNLRETVELLIASGADAKQPDMQGITPLMDASSKGCDRVVMRTLLKAGARLQDRDRNDLDAFEHGLLWGHDGLDELLAAGYRMPAARAKELLAAYADNPVALPYIRKASAAPAARPGTRATKKAPAP